VTDSNYEQAIVAKKSDAESDAASVSEGLQPPEENLTNPRGKRKKPVKTLALGAEGTGLEQSLDSQGNTHASVKATHNATHSTPMLKDKAYSQAISSIAQSRQHIERLLADVGRDEHYTLSILGPILSNLKDAQASLEHLRNNA